MLYLELFLAALAAFLLGFLWYTALFGKAWQRETGITHDQAKSGMLLTHGVAFLMMFLIAYFAFERTTTSVHIQEGNAGHGAFHIMMLALKVALPLLVINYMYQKKSLKLILIDGGYAVCFFAVIGAVMALLPLHDPTPSVDTAQAIVDYYGSVVDKYQGIIDAHNSGGN